MKPKISVLMPAYNAEKYIEESVTSILNQTFTDFELIVIDDCSTDNTWSAIQAMADEDSRVSIWQNKQNIGVAATRNALIARSKGDYIVWQDADDISLPARLTKQYEFMESHAQVGIAGGYIEFFDEHASRGVRKYASDDSELRRKMFTYSPVAQPAAIIRKKCFESAGLYSAKLQAAEDLDMSFRIGRHYAFANIQEVILRYRVQESGITHQKLRAMERNTLAIRRQYFSDSAYTASGVDKIRTYLQYPAMYLIPTRLKLFLFNYYRNSSTNIKILVSPAHYVLDKKSVSEFYYAGMLLDTLAHKDSTQEYFVLCGYCADKESVPPNVRIYELFSSPQVTLSLWRRIYFYSWIFFKSIQISLNNKIDIIWHLLPNGKFSFNFFILLKLHTLLGIKRTVIGRLAHSYGEDESNTLVYEAGKVTVKKKKADFIYQALYMVLSPFSKLYFRTFDRYIFYNESSKIDFEQFLDQKYGDNAAIIPVGFEPSSFPYFPKKLSPTLTFLYMGNLITRKNVAAALSICRLLKDQGILFTFDIVGDGYERDALERLTRELDLQKEVTFRGFVPKSEIHAFYKKAQFLFLLSHKEAFGHVLLEAWGSGTVFVGSRIEVFEEMVVDGKTGYLVDIEKTEGLSTFVENLKNITECEYQSIVEQSYEKSKEYTWDNISEKYYTALFR